MSFGVAAAVATGISVAGWFASPIVSKLLDHKFFKNWMENEELKKGLEKEVECLRSVLVKIKSITEDAEGKQFKSSVVCKWVGSLRDVMLDAEDVLDLHQVEVELLLRKQRDAEPSSKNKVTSIFHSFWSSSSGGRLSAAKEIENISERLEGIFKQGLAFGLESRMARSAPAVEDSDLFEKRRTSSFPEEGESAIVGRENVKEEMIKQLVPAAAEIPGVHPDGDEGSILVIGIVGMGGLGKTTLAQLVFNDNRVVRFYNSRAWVCVGQSYNLDLIQTTKNIIESVRSRQGNPKACSLTTLDALQSTLLNEIVEPFLLVLDDAWDKDATMCGKLLAPLKVSKKRCRVIVTTRDRQVANAFPHISDVFGLDILDDKSMWSILARAAFGNTEDASKHLGLEAIGKQIVQRLKGLPLAAKTIGGILRRNREAAYWKSILYSEHLLNKDSQEKDFMISVLMLSYHNLPANVKQLFSCISLFPKDYPFQLTTRGLYDNTPNNKWMIQRLSLIETEINSSCSSSDCVDELLDRSLLQYRRDGFRIYISVHDLIHDLAELIKKGEFIRIDDCTKKKSIPEKIRHVSFFQKRFDADPAILEDVSKCKSLRTLIYENVYESINGDLLNRWFQNLIYLRVLSMCNCRITSLPDSIGNLKLLRYLDLCLPKITELPSTISELENLQGLNLWGCSSLSELPSYVTRLINLRHLDAEPKLLQKVNGVGQFRYLQEWKEFHVEERDGHGISQLKNMNELCGSLSICNLERVKSRENAQEARLDEKEKLQRLELGWDPRDRRGDGGLQAGIAEGLRPHTGLEELLIKNYRGNCLPNWWTDTPFNCLVHLHVVHCHNLENIPSLPPTLQSLRLAYNFGLKSLLFSSSSPPPTSLQKLEVTACYKLDESLNALVEASSSSLVDLDILSYDCPLEGLAGATALSKLKLYGCKGKIILNFAALASLTKMAFHTCPNVEELNSDPELCSTLTYLHLAVSPQLELLSKRRALFTSLTVLHIFSLKCDNSALSKCLCNATALKGLRLESCANITSLPSKLMHSLAAIEVLHIECCERLVELAFPLAANIRILITGCPEIFSRACPPIINPAIKDLDVRGLNGEQLSNLFSSAVDTSIQSLTLTSCTITDDAAAWVLSSSLQSLRVYGCPRLKELHEQGDQRFSHIPYVTFTRYIPNNFHWLSMT